MSGGLTSASEPLAFHSSKMFTDCSTAQESGMAIFYAGMGGEDIPLWLMPNQSSVAPGMRHGKERALPSYTA